MLAGNKICNIIEKLLSNGCVCAAMLARDAPNKSVMQHKDHVHHWCGIKQQQKLPLHQCFKIPKSTTLVGCMYTYLSAIVCRLEIFSLCKKRKCDYSIVDRELGGGGE
jgi:hypothetical protein